MAYSCGKTGERPATVVSAVVDLQRGTCLGDYELLVQIGRGGMANVWVARDLEAGIDAPLVAVKCVLPELGRDPRFRSMFLNECGLVKSIEHPNVVKLHKLGEDQGVLYMAMEWVAGDSLKAVITEAKKRKPIPPEMAVRIIADAAAGLHAAHELRGWDGELRNVVHCDVSPHNILIGIDGAVKLVDFGVANAMSHVEESTEVRGKLAYMSPEQVNLLPLDRRSDVFSLGIVLFELTTGQRLFKGRDDAHSVDLVKWGKIPRPTELDGRYPPKLQSIVLRALERDVDTRYQTAEELQVALERYLVSERILVPRAGVGGLTQRVLGTRLEKIRHAVRAALRDLDGSALRAAMLPSSMLGDRDDASSLSQLSLPSPAPSQSDTPGVARMPSEHPGPVTPAGTESAATSETSATSVLTASQPPPPRKSRSLVLVYALLGLLAVAVALVALRQLRPDATVVSQTGTSSTEPHEASKKTVTHVVSGSEVNIDSLPVEGEDSGERNDEQSGRRDSKDAKQDDENEDDDDILELDGEGARATGASPTSRPKPADVVLDEEESKKAAEPKKKKKKLPPMKERSPPNRGAMLAALGRASGRAASCKRSGGPSGSGQANVTFSPDGHVSAVSVSGSFAGSAVGRCVQAAFRGATVPPFRGSPVSVARTFTIPN